MDLYEVATLVTPRFRDSFIFEVTATRREQSDLCSLRVMLPPVTISLATQR